jgi:hypothetical protein
MNYIVAACAAAFDCLGDGGGESSREGQSCRS